MKRRLSNAFSLMISTLVLTVLMSACSSREPKPTVDDSKDLPDRDNRPVVLINAAPGSAFVFNQGCKIDYSNASSGYIMAAYTGSISKIKLEIQKQGDEKYVYDIIPNAPITAFPLSSGDGDYQVTIYTNISGDEYAQGASANFTTSFDATSPYLRPNQYVEYDEETKAVKKAEEVVKGAKSDLGALEEIFIYITKTISYDDDEAKNVKPGYIPNPDRTLERKKGICFDYASLFTAMSRSQRIPTKIVVGYAGKTYHAWISVYLDGKGWVDNIIEFHGDEWTMMDPTFVASGDYDDPNDKNIKEPYKPMYFY